MKTGPGFAIHYLHSTVEASPFSLYNVVIYCGEMNAIILTILELSDLNCI